MFGNQPYIDVLGGSSMKVLLTNIPSRRNKGIVGRQIAELTGFRCCS